MGKVMRHTLGASLNIRHNLSSSKGPKPLQLKLLTTYIPKTSAFTLAFSIKTSYDADNRPLLVMRSNLWASGYDVDGTDQTSLGQFSGRVQQTYKHSVPRFFV